MKSPVFSSAVLPLKSSVECTPGLCPTVCGLFFVEICSTTEVLVRSLGDVAIEERIACIEHCTEIETISVREDMPAAEITEQRKLSEFG